MRSWRKPELFNTRNYIFVLRADKRDSDRVFSRALSIVVVVLTVFVVISVVAMVRVVIVLNTAAISFPVTRVIPFAVVTRANPASALVGRPSPIAFMPLVMVSHGIPIGLDPHIFRAGTDRNHSHDPRGRGRPDSDSNRDLSAKHRHASKQCYGKQCG